MDGLKEMTQLMLQFLREAELDRTEWGKMVRMVTRYRLRRDKTRIIKDNITSTLTVIPDAAHETYTHLSRQHVAC